MPYAVGIELQPEQVRIVTITDLGVEGAEESLPPILFVGNDGVWIGVEASERSLDQPESLVSDVIGQFTVDRIWLAGGRILTPDTALQELLACLVSSLKTSKGGSAYAVTLSCPSGWASEDKMRAEEVARAADLPRIAVVSALSAEAAAFNAAQRLPSAVPGTSGPEPGDLSGGAWVSRRPEANPPDEMPIDPIRSESRRNNRALIAVGFAGIVMLTTAAVVLTVSKSHHGQTRPTVPTTSPNPTAAASTSPPITAQQSLRIGFIDANGGSNAVLEAVRAINADQGVLGRPVQLSSAPAGANAETTAASLVAGGASVLITDGDTAITTAVIAGSGPNSVVVCSPTGSAALSSSSSIDLVGSPVDCAALVSLAAEYAGSLAPSSLISATRLFVTQSGVACSSYSQCKSYVDDQQPVSMALTGGNQVTLYGS